MLKNRIFGVITAAALVSAAACGGEEEAATVEGEGVVVSTDTAITTTTELAPVVAPVTDTTGVATATIVEADTTVRTEVVPNP